MSTSKFQFISPYLVELSFVVNPEFNVEDDEFEMKNSFFVNVKKMQNTNRAKVELTLEINMENEDAPFQLKIKVASDFIWEELDGEKVDSLLNMNAPALLLGYMRPIVANITNSSSFPVYNIPFINFKD